MIPLVFAAILAAIFVPLVDRLERLQVRRWLGAPLVVLLAIAVVSMVAWMVMAGLVGQGREVLARVTAGLWAAATEAPLPQDGREASTGPALAE